MAAMFVNGSERQTAASGNSFFWLVDSKKYFPLKPLGQMNRNLVGSIYGMFSIKIAHFVPMIKFSPKCIHNMCFS
jgi:hypothetical protein